MPASKHRQRLRDDSIAYFTTQSSYAQSRCCPESTTGWSTGCLRTTTIGGTPVAPWSSTWSRQSPTRPHPPCRTPHQSHNHTINTAFPVQHASNHVCVFAFTRYNDGIVSCFSSAQLSSAPPAYQLLLVDVTFNVTSVALGLTLHDSIKPFDADSVTEYCNRGQGVRHSELPGSDLDLADPRHGASHE